MGNSVTIRLLAGLGAALLLAACGDEQDVATVQVPHVYDDFSGGAIDPARWSVDTSGGGVITVANGHATLSVDAAGADVQSRLLLPTALAAANRTLAVRVMPTRYFEDPSSNVRFRITVRYYKDDATALGGLDSDIFGQLRIRADQFQALVSRCTNTTCGTSNVILSNTLGPVQLNRWYDMAMTWNGDQLISFHVPGVGSVDLDASFGGTFNRIGPSAAPRALLEVNASSGAPTVGNMTAVVDEVVCVRQNLDPC